MRSRLLMGIIIPRDRKGGKGKIYSLQFKVRWIPAPAFAGVTILRRNDIINYPRAGAWGSLVILKYRVIVPLLPEGALRCVGRGATRRG